MAISKIFLKARENVRPETRDKVKRMLKVMDLNTDPKYITYETAILAREKGFNVHCDTRYDERTKVLESYKDSLVQTFIDRDPAYYYHYISSLKDDYNEQFENNDEGFYVLAPTKSELATWLREIHNIEVNVMKYTYSGGKYQGRKYMWLVDQYDEKYNHELEENLDHWILNERKSDGWDFNTYEDALECGLVEALNMMV